MTNFSTDIHLISMFILLHKYELHGKTEDQYYIDWFWTSLVLKGKINLPAIYLPCTVVTGGVFLVVVVRKAMGESNSVDKEAAAVARLGFCG